MKDCVSSLHIGFRIATPSASSLMISIFVNLNKVSRMEPIIHRWRSGKDCYVPLIFPHVIEIAQPDYTRRDSTALGIIRTLSRIDRMFLPTYG